MRLHTEQHQQYCGIDLRTNKIYLCILNQEGALLPYRKSTPSRNSSPKPSPLSGGSGRQRCRHVFMVLAIDTQRITALLRGGLIPSAYVYPLHMRAAATLSLHNPIPC